MKLSETDFSVILAQTCSGGQDNIAAELSSGLLHRKLHKTAAKLTAF